MRKSVRRATIVLALTPVVSFPTAVALASGSGNTAPSVSQPAPPGDSSAVAAEVNGVISVGKTKAHAGSDGGSADADALTVLGTQISGGSQKGVGSKNGNLIGTGDTPVGDAEVAPWSAAVTDKNGGVQSAAEAALAHAKVNGVAEAWVLHSKSAATWTPDSSTGDAESDVAEVSALGLLDVKVLHSEAHSTGKGESDLLVVNGTGIGTSSQANGSCKLSVPPLLDVLCLNASGGLGKNGITSAAASVANIDAISGAVTSTLSGSASGGGKAAGPTPSQKAHRPSTSSGGGQTTGDRAGRPQASGLPFTGADTARLALFALVTTLLGAMATTLGRRRRPVA